MRPSSDAPLTESETIVMAPLLMVAALITLAWAAGLLGVPLAAWPLFVGALVLTFFLLRWIARDGVAIDRRRAAVLALVMVASAAYICVLSWPRLLPITEGPDLIHHLTLIHFIQHRHALPRAPIFGQYLLEMRGYTPGSHLLAALTGNLLHVDGLRLVHPLMAISVALRTGLLFNLLLRIIPGPRNGTSRIAAALAGALLLFVPHAYLLEPIVRFGFYSQTIAETFALAMLWASIAWYEQPSRAALVMFAACGVGVVLCWPVLAGPPLGAMALLVLFKAFEHKSIRTVAIDLAVAVAPALAVMTIHSWANPAAAGILRSGGSAVTASIQAFGWAWLALAAAGCAIAVARLRGQLPIVLYTLVSLAQVGALVVVQARLHATNPYFAQKTMHLVVYAGVVFGGLTIATVVAWILRFAPDGWVARASWLVPILVVGWLARTDLPRKPMRSFVSPEVWEAGQWARDHLPAACVEYMTPQWQTGYWLHFDVLGNPRLGGTRLSHETFVYHDAVGLWILPGSLPYAIVENLAELPREAAEHTRVLQRFGRAAVVERSDGRAECSDHTPPIQLVN